MASIRSSVDHKAAKQATKPGAMLRAWCMAGAGFVLTSAALMAQGVGDQAAAQSLVNHNSDAPVDVAADALELQSRADRAVISGNVRIDQAGLTLRAARVTIAYSDAGRVNINRIDAVGGVTVTKGSDRASGNSAIYDLDRRIITLIGGVELQQGANRLNGGRMVIDLTSGRASVDGRGAVGGSAAPGDAPGTATTSSGGRVTGRFTVPRRQE
jgi:lipopolysaccharide export system protein LptA